MPSTTPQPDQQPDQWNAHVGAYEEVFEPLSTAFAETALGALTLRAGERLLDVGCGSGGAALLAASHGVSVMAVDGPPAWWRARTSARRWLVSTWTPG